MKLSFKNSDELLLFINKILKIFYTSHSIDKLVKLNIEYKDIKNILNLFLEEFSKLLYDKKLKGNNYKFIVVHKNIRIVLTLYFDFGDKHRQFTIRIVTIMKRNKTKLKLKDGVIDLNHGILLYGQQEIYIRK